MEDRRCKLGLAGRLELVRMVEQGYSLRAAAAAVGVAPATRTAGGIAGGRHLSRSASPGSASELADQCPGVAHGRSRQSRSRRSLTARKKTNWGPMRLTYLAGSHRSTIWKVLARNGCSRRRRSSQRQSSRRYEWSEAERAHQDQARAGQRHVGLAAGAGTGPALRRAGSNDQAAEDMISATVRQDHGARSGAQGRGGRRVSIRLACMRPGRRARR